ncbi:cell division protein FtsQ/DivIB [Parapedomonas caeni]
MSRRKKAAGSSRRSAKTTSFWTASLRRRAVIGGGLAVTGIVLGLGVWLFDVPQRLAFGVAQGVAGLGFEVKHVKISGVENAPKLAIYSAVFDGRSNSMLLVDIDDVRARLMANPWIAEASVARRLPDTLDVVVRERKPVAVWQRQGRLAVIDAEGRVLDNGERVKRFGRLPLVVGVGAEAHARALFVMLAGHPDLAGQLDSATWVGDRRWDLRFRSGELLMLPEGDDAAVRAVSKFATMDRNAGLLGRGFARFDMRQEDRMYTRKLAAVPARVADGAGQDRGVDI